MVYLKRSSRCVWELIVRYDPSHTSGPGHSAHDGDLRCFAAPTNKIALTDSCLKLLTKPDKAPSIQAPHKRRAFRMLTSGRPPDLCLLMELISVLTPGKDHVGIHHR